MRARGGTLAAQSDRSVLQRLARFQTQFAAAHEGEVGQFVGAHLVEQHLGAVVRVRHERRRP